MRLDDALFERLLHTPIFKSWPADTPARQGGLPAPQMFSESFGAMQ